MAKSIAQSIGRASGAVNLCPGLIGIAQVNGPADAMIGSAVTEKACIQDTLQHSRSGPVHAQRTV
tara:strand:+ start:410 stop:604 length:195 start_codon:yes stop_codon:yes gene_type:complete